MPIISQNGSRSFKVRFIYGCIFLILTIGALSMLYPLSLMLSTSVKSEADIGDITPWPKFWNSDAILFKKYVESKYLVNLELVDKCWTTPVTSFPEIEPPAIDPATRERVEAFRAWREGFEMPLTWYFLGHSSGGQMLARNAREFRKQMIERFDGDLDAYVAEMGIPALSWSSVNPPPDYLGYSRRYAPEYRGLEVPFRKFKARVPPRDRAIFNLDAVFVANYLKPLYTTDVAVYNEKHGTAFESYNDILLTPKAPPGGLARDDWEAFVRDELNVHFIRVSADQADGFRRHLEGHYGDIAALNKNYGASYASFDQVPFRTTPPEALIKQADWSNFLKNRDECSLDAIEVYGPRQAFEEYLARTRHVPIDRVRPTRMPVKAVDWTDMNAHTSDIRWEFTTRNYKQVFDYIVLHGYGVINTVIYCSLMIAASLLVNPLAAYGLSRYNPPSTYKIILFCMATMAFPPAVTMIPAFLLMKRFPLLPVAGGVVAFFVVAWLVRKLSPKISERWQIILAAAGAVAVGWYVIPAALGKPTVSLLNTFAALILPTMANGYFLFLLKGFFDSLPKELYEAADLDGASEWTKFWIITMNLSKPILAVIALQAFTAAYSNFMMALIIIPDRSMWTIMVWIFQLQSQVHTAVVNASLVIAAIPTFIVFVLCQGVIMRGIVVPTEK